LYLPRKQATIILQSGKSSIIIKIGGGISIEENWNYWSNGRRGSCPYKREFYETLKNIQLIPKLE